MYVQWNGATQWRMYFWDIFQIFETSVLEGNLFQVVVINNELLNPIQLNIEPPLSHKIKSKCKFIDFILLVVSWKDKLFNKAKRLRDKVVISQCTLLNMTVKVITALETTFELFVYTYVHTFIKY